MNDFSTLLENKIDSFINFWLASSLYVLTELGQDNLANMAVDVHVRNSRRLSRESLAYHLYLRLRHTLVPHPLIGLSIVSRGIGNPIYKYFLNKNSVFNRLG
jgi:hypothetical protein